MKNTRLFIIIAMLVSLMLACNISVGDTSAPPPTAVVVVVTQLVAADTAVPQVANATETETPEPEVLPSETPGVVVTSTASTPMVTPLKDPVNCRFGPSMFWEQAAALNVGVFMPIIGKSADGGWWQVMNTNSTNQYNQSCWVGASVTTTTGELSGIPTVPAPQALITDVQLQIKPNSVNLGSSCSNYPSSPFSLKGTISTNGPLEIKWHFETEQNGSQPEHTLKFATFGPQPISVSFVPSAWKKGSYWIRLVITAPQSMVSDVTYQVKCQ